MPARFHEHSAVGSFVHRQALRHTINRYLKHAASASRCCTTGCSTDSLAAEAGMWPIPHDVIRAYACIDQPCQWVSTGSAGPSWAPGLREKEGLSMAKQCNGKQLHGAARSAIATSGGSHSKIGAAPRRIQERCTTVSHPPMTRVVIPNLRRRLPTCA
jgi:hypothetical protein